MASNIFTKSGNSFFVINNESIITDDKPISVPSVMDAKLAKINTNIQSAISSIQNHSIINIFKCGEIIGGHRLVYLDDTGLLRYADIQNRISIENIIGVTIDAGNKNDSVRVQILGILNETTWNFEPNKKLFLSTIGNLTQEIPIKGICKEIGFAITKTKIMVRIQKAIFLSEE